MDLGLQRYAAFLEVAVTESFTAAAKKLGYTQSGISRMIASLETSLGIVLFERLHGKVILTPEGRELLPRIAALYNDSLLLEQDAASLKGLERGTVRIGTFTSVATYWLPRIIAKLRRSHPGIDYELKLGDYREIEGWIEDGSVDCGFVRLPLRGDRHDVETIELANDEFMAIIPEGHELADADSFPIERLSDRPFLELVNGEVSDVAFIFERSDIEIDPWVSTWDDYAIMAMVESGLGIAVLPSLVLTRSPFHVKTLPLDPPAHRTIALAMRVSSPLSTAARAFVDATKESVLP